MPRTEAGISGGLPLFECSSILIWPPQRPTYKNKNSTIFWCFIFSLQPYTFRALFNHAKLIYHVLYVHLTLISALCWLAKTDSPVNEGREHCLWNSNSLDMTASSPSALPRCQNALGEFARRLQNGTQSSLLYFCYD